MIAGILLILLDTQRTIYKLGYSSTKRLSNVWPTWYWKNFTRSCLCRSNKRFVPFKLTIVPEHQTNILATFLKLAGSALVQMFIGDGARLVRDAFALGLSFFSFENDDSSKMSFVRLTTTRKHR